ncbi:hypothetical protein HSX10_17320 [Winogradskyella undariae]|uniref:DUF6705 family protein n=1 Tax=Winogradskyella undariae TaxID=1285465 RepID=UPI00156B4061|nr:DUF6705 family protein [Winogradskyella undariae]NRR93337.1 hypothetical protein [Winogradskyella undariae]QNK78259.1 hypothetical protein H7F37_04020 [Winogradskyella sp. PAMC22761]
MKQLITLAFTIVLYSYGSAQTVIDLSQESFDGDTENGTYYHKDINNYMQPYVGTWQYIDGNTEFRIILTKVEMFHVILPEANIDYYKDGLTIQYQKYENNILTYNSIIDSHPSGIIQEFGILDMTFTDYQRNDSLFELELTLIATGINERNSLKFELNSAESKNTYHDEHPNEPYFSVPNNIVMTRM